MVIKFYRYIFCRVLVFFQQTMSHGKNTALLSSSYALGLSLISLSYSLDLIIRKVFNVEGVLTNGYRIALVAVALLAFEMVVIFPANSNKEHSALMNKFTWNAKDVLTLLFVFGPIFLLPILMLMGVKE